MLLGFFAGIFGTVLSIYTFTLGADLGIRTLLISSSVVPGTLLAAIVWPTSDSLTKRQVGGIAVFLVAIWTMLDFPSLAILLTLENWVWLTLTLALVNALGELIARAMAVKFDVWTNNIWIGGSTIGFSLVTLALFLVFSDNAAIEMSRTFLAGTLAIGVIVVAMVSFKIFAYQGGGTIALKKIIMPGVYLITAMLAGIAIYDEPLTVGKLVGALLWFAAVYLADTKAAADMKVLIRRTTS